MARTFTYDKRQRNHQQPPLRASWRSTTQATAKRGKYADLADRVHEHRIATTNRRTEQIDETPERQKRPVSP